MRTRLVALTARVEQATEEIERLRGACERAQMAEEPLVAQVESAESARLSAEAAAEIAGVALQDAGADLARWQVRSDALAMALDEARARAGAQRLAGLDGVLGTLLDLVEVDEGWEPAFEAAAGEAMLAVVVDEPATAAKALRHLMEGDATGAVLALRRPSGVVALSPVVGGELVRRHVRARDGRVDGLLDSLLATAFRVDGWEQAVEIAASNPAAVVVTPDGHRFSATGWRLGAAGGGATAAALDDARSRADSARSALQQREADIARTRDELRLARQAEADVARSLDANDATFTAASEALARLQGERREGAVEVEALERTLSEVTERCDREHARIAELEVLLPALEADEASETAADKARGDARAALETRAASLASRRKDLEVRNAGLHDRHDYLQHRLEENERRLAADVAARAEAEQHRSKIERALGAIDRLASLVEGHRATIEGEHGRLQEIRRRQSDEVRALAQRLDVLRRSRTDAERSLDETRERAQRAEIDAAEVRLRLETAVETLRRDLDTEPEAAEASTLPELPEGVSAAARTRDLERELRLMGPINPLALEEFTALQERHTFLEEQLEDVKGTRRELLRIIRAVDHEIQSVFAEAFADVASNFEVLFSVLFPGGIGRLVLTTPEDLLNTGIEVEAKPSGKNVKKLSLLSGGERSLTALAYLFAVFRSRPSPFYVMDEVEAALDDVNLHRFLGLIAEFRDEAQLLVVSHQKRTMEAADCLLGVTMQPGGSSRVLVEHQSANA